MRIEVLVDVKTMLGEGPLWDVEQQRLYWIDQPACASSAHRPGQRGPRLGRARASRLDGHAQGRQGRHLSLANGFHALDFKTGECTLIADTEPDKPNNRINDGKVDRRGRFFAGSMDSEEEGPNGALYRLDPDFSVTKLETGIIVSNGPCWSPDDKIFYFADTWSGEIWAYDYDITTGKLANRRTFTKIDTSHGGAADGSTVDAEGCLGTRRSMTASSIRYTPDGKVDRVIEMPVKKVTSVMFGGPNLDILYVTSMAKPPLPRFPGDGVLRGSLFAITGLGIKGVAEPRFGA